MADAIWQDRTRKNLIRDAARLDALAMRAGWSLVGGTPLFRTYATPDAAQAQETLAHQKIWTRRFEYSAHWLRLGLPGAESQWARLEAALLRPSK